MAKKIGFQQIEGSVTAPKGFRAAAVFCDIKRLGTGQGLGQRAEARFRR